MQTYLLHRVKGGVSGKTILVFLGGVLGMLLLAAILFPIFAQAKIGNGRNPCYGRIREQLQAVSFYLNDYDQKLPIAKSWMDAIGPDMRRNDPAAFQDTPPLKPGEYGYAFRLKASGVSETSIKNPKRFALIFDSMLKTRNAASEMETLPHPGRHHERDTIGFLDGHTRPLPMP